jgi:broad specificity phosphatase PhoE
MLAIDRLVIVRHGESTYNAERRLQGQADPPLSERGRQEATALAASLNGVGTGRVVTSDLIRARETAALLGHPDAPTDVRLREIDVGEWQGRPLGEFPGGFETSWRGGPLTPPGGETWEQLVERVGAAVDELIAAGGPWLVVAHGGVVRAAVVHLTGADPQRLDGPANCSVTVVEGGRLLGYAWTPTLSAS